MQIISSKDDEIKLLIFLINMIEQRERNLRLQQVENWRYKLQQPANKKLLLWKRVELHKEQGKTQADEQYCDQGKKDLKNSASSGSMEQGNHRTVLLSQDAPLSDLRQSLQLCNGTV